MRVAIGLGSSLGDRRAQLELVVRMLDSTPGLRLIRGSRWYRTPPLRGGTARNWFLNGVAVFESDRAPQDLLAVCVALEQRFGRRRARRWGDRTIDLDLLLIDGVICQEPSLRVPHPAIASRPFVLLPLLEAWPDAVDPVSGRPFASCPVPSGPRPAPVGVLARRPAVA